MYRDFPMFGQMSSPSCTTKESPPVTFRSRTKDLAPDRVYMGWTPVWLPIFRGCVWDWSPLLWDTFTKRLTPWECDRQRRLWWKKSSVLTFSSVLWWKDGACPLADCWPYTQHLENSALFEWPLSVHYLYWLQPDHLSVWPAVTLVLICLEFYHNLTVSP